MIIGQFSDAFPPITDGVAQVVKNYAKLLNTRNNLSYVITPVVPEAEYNYTFPVITYKSLNLRGRKYYRLGIPYCDKDFNKKIKKINFDIIHAHSPFVSGKIGKKIANKLDVPFIATFHSKYRDDFKQVLKFDFLVDRIIKRIVAFYESADEVVAQDFFETICLHGTINYNLFIYDSFFISIGVASDIFMQFDFDQVHSHYTAFTIGPYGAIGYKFKNEKKEKLNISISLNLPIIAMENKDTNIIEEPQEEAWNELIDYNSSLFNMVSMAYKLNVSIPF